MEKLALTKRLFVVMCLFPMLFGCVDSYCPSDTDMRLNGFFDDPVIKFEISNSPEEEWCEVTVYDEDTGCIVYTNY